MHLPRQDPHEISNTVSVQAINLPYLQAGELAIRRVLRY